MCIDKLNLNTFPKLTLTYFEKNEKEDTLWFFRLYSAFTISACFHRHLHTHTPTHTHIYVCVHGVSEKTVQNYFCQNFVKFPSIVTIFGW